MSLQDLQNGTTGTFDPTVTHDGFLDQLFSGLQSTVSWSDISAGDGQNKSTLPWTVDHFDDQSAFLSSNLRQRQISTAGDAPTALQLPRGLGSGLFQNDNSSFKSPIGDNDSIQNLFHGFTGPLTSDQTQQSFGSPRAVMMGPSAAAGVGGGGGAPSQPRQRVRARRGQATDPHSISERLRRERIAERMKALQELVPNANKTDRASMLDDIIDYVKFLQLQVKVLSMSRLGGASSSTLVAEGGGGGDSGLCSSNALSSFFNDSTTVTENQVIKLMEEDIGSAMQYLQGKGLCLMPISIATVISTNTRSNHPLGVGGPSSPNMSVLTVQSANRVSLKNSP